MSSIFSVKCHLGVHPRVALPAAADTPAHNTQQHLHSAQSNGAQLNSAQSNSAQLNSAQSNSAQANASRHVLMGPENNFVHFKHVCWFLFIQICSSFHQMNARKGYNSNPNSTKR